MESPQLTLVIILLLFIFFSPNQPNVRFQTPRELARLAIEKQQDFDALTNSTYGDLSANKLNLTGLRTEDGYQLQLINVAQELARRQHIDSWYSFPSNSPIYYDVDGQVNGDFVSVDVKIDPERHLNLTKLDPLADYISHVWERNVTDRKGTLSIDLQSISPPSKFIAREIKAVLSIVGDETSERADARLRGLQFPSGSMVFATGSRKFNALPALPHFGLSEGEFNRAKPIVNASLTEIWKSIDQGQVDDSPILVAPKCELIMWLHQRPLQGDRKYIEQIEKELSNPDGAPVAQVPSMAFTAIIVSPDCGYILQADTVHGPKAAVWSDLIRRLLAALCIFLGGQIFLLKRQMEKCATPSTRSRVSYHTFVIAAFSDGLMFFSLVGVVVVDISLFLIAGIAAFLCCIFVAFLEVKFIFDIWSVQVGDPARAQQERQRRATTVPSTSAASNPPSATTASGTDQPTQETTTAETAPPARSSTTPSLPLSGAGLPLPATAATTNPPAIVVTQTNTTAIPMSPRSTFLSLYSRFYFALINLMFFTLWSASWSPTPRHIYLNTLALIFSSLWLPQIYRNTMRNCRKALTWEYILGTSVLRIAPILYWYLEPRNALRATTNPRMALILVLWLSLQIFVMAIQQFVGPRTFVPEKWCPSAYDYHPILFDDLEAGGLPIGEITSASEGKDAETKGQEGSRKVFDCAICMNEIDVPVISKSERKGGTTSSGRTWLEQRSYMVTPCRHLFHTECLDGWMNMRLVCPVCREGLPPL